MAVKKWCSLLFLANLIICLGSFKDCFEPADTKADYCKVNVIVVSNNINNLKINKSDMEKIIKKQVELEKVQSPEKKEVKNPSHVH